MTEREKLELAAKALGNDAQYVCTMFNATDDKCESYGFLVAGKHWKPLNDQADGDLLACDLEIEIEFYQKRVIARHKTIRVDKVHDNTLEGRRAAVREARLLVAVEIGRAMK